MISEARADEFAVRAREQAKTREEKEGGRRADELPVEGGEGGADALAGEGVCLGAVKGDLTLAKLLGLLGLRKVLGRERRGGRRRGGGEEHARRLRWRPKVHAQHRAVRGGEDKGGRRRKATGRVLCVEALMKGSQAFPDGRHELGERLQALHRHGGEGEVRDVGDVPHLSCGWGEAVVEGIPRGGPAATSSSARSWASQSAARRFW